MTPFDLAQLQFLEAAHNPSFTITLPPWERHEALSPAVFRMPNNPLQVVETLGDAAMHLAVPLVLHRLHPRVESPQIFTAVRSAVTSNKSLYYLMKRARLSDNSPPIYNKSSRSAKYVADEFETRIGAFFLDKGFEPLCVWVSKALGPLITACLDVFQQINSDASSTRKRARSEDPGDDDTVKRARTSPEDHSITPPEEDKTQRPILNLPQERMQTPGLVPSSTSIAPHEDPSSTQRPIVNLPQDERSQPGLDPSSSSAWAASESVSGPARLAHTGSSAKENSVPSYLPSQSPAPIPCHATSILPPLAQDCYLQGHILLPRSTENLASGSSRKNSKPEMLVSSITAATRRALPLGQTSTPNTSALPRLSSLHGGHTFSQAPVIGVSSHYAPWGYLQNSRQTSGTVSVPPTLLSRMTPDWPRENSAAYNFQL